MKYPSLMLLFFSTGIAHAQQNNNWYFGTNAAITFNQNTGQPVPAAIHNSVMVANEAAASISDKKGKLLFYTNGVDVYNQRHELMQNGNDIGGHLSACQVLIVPQPGSNSFYYIGTTDSIEINNDGKNDVMRPLMPRTFTLLEFSIHNRWGHRIFTTSQKDLGWNGKINEVLQDSGAYVWLVRALDTNTGKQHNRKGTFIIIR